MNGANEEAKKDPAKSVAIPPSSTFCGDHLIPKEKQNEESAEKPDLLYGINDVPPWYLCIFLGFQVRIENEELKILLLKIITRTDYNRIESVLIVGDLIKI